MNRLELAGPALSELSLMDRVRIHASETLEAMRKAGLIDGGHLHHVQRSGFNFLVASKLERFLGRKVTRPYLSGQEILVAVTSHTFQKELGVSKRVKRDASNVLREEWDKFHSRKIETNGHKK